MTTEPRDAEVAADEETFERVKALADAEAEKKLIAAAGAQIEDLFSDFDRLVQPVEPAPLPSDEELASVVALAVYHRKLESAIAEATERLKGMNTERDRVAQVLLPNALLKIGMTDFRLTNGATVEIETKLHASITAANKEPAHDWLIESDNGDLIKTSIKVEFGRDELMLAQALAVALKARWPKRKITATESVNPQTLGAFCRELDAEGKEFPEDLFGVHRVTLAVIREPGEKAKGSKQPKTHTTDTED